MVSEISSSLKATDEKRNITEEEAEKIAAKLVEKDKKLSGAKTFFFPVWNVAVSVNGREFLLKYSGVSGELVERESVPQREKGTLEIVQETLEEMKNPKNWVKMGKEIASEAKKGFS